jgi:hypothetical protein
LIGSTHRGEAQTRDQILIAELSQPDEVALSKAEARDCTHITQKKTVRKGETSSRARPHVFRGFAGLACGPRDLGDATTQVGRPAFAPCSVVRPLQSRVRRIFTAGFSFQ